MWLICWKEYWVTKWAVNGPTIPHPLTCFNGPARYWPGTLLTQPVIAQSILSNGYPTHCPPLMTANSFLFRLALISLVQQSRFGGTPMLGQICISQFFLMCVTPQRLMVSPPIQFALTCSYFLLRTKQGCRSIHYP